MKMFLFAAASLAAITAPAAAVDLRAAIDADHPDYDEDWAPATA